MARLIKIASWPGKSRCHVVFVHGLGGHAYDTWQCNPDNDSFWPLWLARDIDGLTVWTISYSAPVVNWLGTAPPLQDRARTVLDEILSTQDISDEPVVFICHSLGGLVVKQMLRAANDQQERNIAARHLLDRIKAVVFIATPHVGAVHATWLDWLRLIFWPSAAAQDLVRNNPNLRDLNIWYRNWSGSIKQRIYYEMRGTAIGKVVDPGSADAGLPGVDPIGVDKDHVRICKPENASDPPYKSIREFLATHVLAETRARKRRSGPNYFPLPEVPDSQPGTWVPIALRATLLLFVGFLGWQGFGAIFFHETPSTVTVSFEDILEKLLTPIGLTAIALLATSTVFLGIIRQAQDFRRSTLFKSIARYSFVIGVVFALINAADLMYDKWLASEYRVTGLVIDEDGQPLALAEVSFVGGPTVETDFDGKFEAVLPRSRFADGYTVVVADSRHETLTKNIRSNLNQTNIIQVKKIPVKQLLIDNVTDINISHWIGGPYVDATFSLTNLNSFSRRLKSVTVSLISPKKENFHLGNLNLIWAAPPHKINRDYYRLKHSTTHRMRGWFFFADVKAQLFDQRIKQELKRKPVNIDPSMKVVRLSADLTNDLQEHARRNFSFYPGTWELTISANMSDGNAHRSFRFELISTQIDAMQSTIVDYEYGFGVVWGLWFAGKNGPKSLVRVAVTPIDR